MTDRHDHLRRVGDELRAVFAEERKAIAKLDHAALAFIAERKRQLADELARAREGLESSPELRALFEAIRVEAHATATLAGAATQAVRAILGISDSANAYDRHANRTTTQRVRTLVGGAY